MRKGLLILAAAGALFARADCSKVTGDRIYGADLARVDARFSALPRAAVIGFAPAPDAKRTFTAAELRLTARANGIPAADFDDICFELRMAPVDRDDAIAAMRRALPPDVTLHLLELSPAEVPAGTLVFPKEALEPAPPSSRGNTINAQLWRGAVKYGDNLQFAIRARVELSISSAVAVANADLPAGIPVAASALTLRILPLPVSGMKALSSVGEIAGKLPRRLIAAGVPIMRSDLIEPPVVRKGDVVAVEVDSGAAHLRFEAEAEAEARAGDLVELRNPAGGKNFKARIDADRKAVIVLPERFNP